MSKYTYRSTLFDRPSWPKTIYRQGLESAIAQAKKLAQTPAASNHYHAATVEFRDCGRWEYRALVKGDQLITGDHRHVLNYVEALAIHAAAASSYWDQYSHIIGFNTLMTTGKITIPDKMGGLSNSLGVYRFTGLITPDGRPWHDYTLNYPRAIELLTCAEELGLWIAKYLPLLKEKV